MAKSAGYWQAIDNMMWHIHANFEKHLGNMTDPTAMFDKLMTDQVIRDGYDKIMDDIGDVVSRTYGVNVEEVVLDVCKKAAQTVLEKRLETK